jgi:hypothetical protein
MFKILWTQVVNASTIDTLQQVEHKRDGTWHTASQSPDTMATVRAHAVPHKLTQRGRLQYAMHTQVAHPVGTPSWKRLVQKMAVESAYRPSFGGHMAPGAPRLLRAQSWAAAAAACQEH